MEGGTGGGPGGGASRPRPILAQSVRTMYLLSTNTVEGRSVTELQPVQVRVGISDGALTEVLEGLKTGDLAVTGATNPAATPLTPVGSPFGGPFGGPRR